MKIQDGDIIRGGGEEVKKKKHKASSAVRCKKKLEHRLPMRLFYVSFLS